MQISLHEVVSRRRWLVAAAISCYAACSFADVEGLAEARTRWSLAAISQYEYGYNKYCDCHPETPPETFVSVDLNSVVDVRHKLVDSPRIVPADPGNFYLYWTIEDLFSLVEAAADRDAIVRVQFHPSLGYPTSIYIDYNVELIGDEVDVKVTSFSATGS